MDPFFDRLSQTVRERVAQLGRIILGKENPFDNDRLPDLTSQFRGWQDQAIDRARQMAAVDGRDQWSMKDYLISARQIGLEQNIPADQWNAKNYTNFDGRTLRGLNMQRNDLSSQGLTAADREALKMTDEEISQFYAEVNSTISFNDTTLYNVHFHPADTFDEYVKGKAKGGSNITFDGMVEGESIHLTGGKNAVFENIRCVNFEGGEIIVGDENGRRTEVKNLDVSGVTAHLTLRKNAFVNHLEVDEHTDILELNVAHGAMIAHADFRNAMVSMASSLEGSKWHDVKFRGTSLHEVNMHGVELSGVTLENCTVDGLDLSGAKIKDLVINGVVIENRKQLEAMVIEADGADISVSPALAAKLAGEKIRGAMQQNDIPAPAPEAVAEKVAVQQAPSPIVEFNGIQFGGAVSLDDAFAAGGGTQIAQMDRNPQTVAREAEQRAAMSSLPPRRA